MQDNTIRYNAMQHSASKHNAVHLYCPVSSENTLGMDHEHGVQDCHVHTLTLRSVPTVFAKRIGRQTGRCGPL